MIVRYEMNRVTPSTTVFILEREDGNSIMVYTSKRITEQDIIKKYNLESVPVKN